MPNLSTAGIGMYAVLIEFLLHMFGLEAPEGSVVAFVNGVIAIAGFILWIYGQVRRNDLHLGLVRK